MTSLATRLLRLIVDESGAEVSELAVMLALVVAGSVGAIALMGAQVQMFYLELKNAFP